MTRLGDLIVGEMPTLNTDIRVFPDSAKLLASATVPDSNADGVFPQSIGQDAGRSNMRGPLPGRYYGAGWLAPNSGTATVAGSLFNPETDGGPSPSLRHGGDIGPITLTSPMPSVLIPRSDRVTPGDVQPCAVGNWVNRNPLLAVGIAVGVFFLFRGGKRG